MKFIILHFLVGWGLKNTGASTIEGFGENHQHVSPTKQQILHLIRSIRTVMKCKNINA
jgi:hypothetical protein